MPSEQPLQVITNFAPLRAVLSLVYGASPDTPVVISGERGTGKTLLGRVIRGTPGRSARVIEIDSATVRKPPVPVGRALLVELPPLRRRSVDIAILADHFGRARCARSVPMSAEALERLESYTWPGNVAELRSVIERTVRAVGFRTIRAQDLVGPWSGPTI